MLWRRHFLSSLVSENPSPALSFILFLARSIYNWTYDTSYFKSQPCLDCNSGTHIHTHRQPITYNIKVVHCVRIILFFFLQKRVIETITYIVASLLKMKYFFRFIMLDFKTSGDLFLHQAIAAIVGEILIYFKRHFI